MDSTFFADPVSWYIGDPVPRWNISDLGVDLANGLIISLTTGVAHSIIVFAWEMNVNKSGSLDIVVIINMLLNKKIYSANVHSLTYRLFLKTSSFSTIRLFFRPLLKNFDEPLFLHYIFSLNFIRIYISSF